jgi:hypothetical protein
VIAVALWLPVAIPAAIAAATGQQFLLIDTSQVINYGQSAEGYFADLLGNLQDVTHGVFWILVVISFAALMIFGKTRQQVMTTFLIFWVAFCLLPLVSLASQPTPRYVVISMPALVLAIAAFAVFAWQHSKALGGVSAAAIVLWAVLYAVPFNVQLMTNPDGLPVGGSNVWFIRGHVTTSDAHRAAGDRIQGIKGIGTLYADWTVCRLVYYYEEAPIHCLEREPVAPQINAIIRNVWQDSHPLYLVTGPYPLDPSEIHDACADRLAYFDSGYNRASVWVIRRKKCPAAEF